MLLVFQSIGITAENPKDTLAVSLVIDTSGSMKDTDPQRLRETAANIFIDLLGPKDYLGIITFNSNVDLVIPMERLGDTINRDLYKTTLNPSLEASGNTDYKAAFNKANEEILKLTDTDVRKVIVFLTDGKPDPDDVVANPELLTGYMNEFWDATIPNLVDNEIAVYSIGFSDDIDIEVLEGISSQTGGSVRIFKDAEDMNKNIIQLLKSREIIATQFLVPTYEPEETQVTAPTISTDFRMKQEGYRQGEEIVVTGSLNIGRARLQNRSDLKVDKFHMVIDYLDGTNKTIELFDDGEADHGDITAKDGLWSNKINFNQVGKATTNLLVFGSFKNEPFTLEKPLGQLSVSSPGSIMISSSDKGLWVKQGQSIILPISIENKSDFKEVVFVEINDSVGSTNVKQIELEPNSTSSFDLDIDLNSKLNNGFHNLKVNFKPLNNLTIIKQNNLDYKIELVSFFEGLSRDVKSKAIIIIPLLIIFIALPLLVFLLGLFLYLLLVRPQLRVRGILEYAIEGSRDEKVQLDLNKAKKNRILISFNRSNTADFNIEGILNNYDLEIYTKLVKKRKAFLLGWTTLFTRNANIVQTLRCTQPGVLLHEGDVLTSITLNSDEEFSSGGYDFHFTKEKSRWNKGPQEGKNILEGRV